MSRTPHLDLQEAGAELRAAVWAAIGPGLRRVAEWLTRRLDRG